MEMKTIFKAQQTSTLRADDDCSDAVKVHTRYGDKFRIYRPDSKGNLHPVYAETADINAWWSRMPSRAVGTWTHVMI